MVVERRPELSVADRLASDGRFPEATDLLTEANREGRDRQLESRIRDIRHLAGVELLDSPPSSPSFPEPAGDAGIVRPIFNPGDALLFDELFMHETGSDPSMPNPRYAIESWFFGASVFPDIYVPLTP